MYLHPNHSNKAIVGKGNLKKKNYLEIQLIKKLIHLNHQYGNNRSLRLLAELDNLFNI